MTMPSCQSTIARPARAYAIGSVAIGFECHDSNGERATHADIKGLIFVLPRSRRDTAPACRIVLDVDACPADRVVITQAPIIEPRLP